MMIYCFVLLYILQLYCIYLYKYQFIPENNSFFYLFEFLLAHFFSSNGASASVVHIVICATHSLSMAHLEDAPLMGKLCVAHINMRHAYFVTNGVTLVARFGESNMRHA